MGEDVEVTDYTDLHTLLNSSPIVRVFNLHIDCNYDGLVFELEDGRVIELDEHGYRECPNNDKLPRQVDIYKAVGKL